jgi:hypothetical protein
MFEFSTGYKPYGKNPRNSKKFNMHMIFKNMNLDWLTCMQHLEDP